MKKQEKAIHQTTEAKLRHLSDSIGDFMRYWGFRKIHGAVWTQLYLSQEALSCTQLANRLKVSKALVSPALEELASYSLIFSVESPNEKTKLYRAQSDVQSVILSILKTREIEMLNSIQNHFSLLIDNKTSSAKASVLEIDKSRFEELARMISAARLVLQLITNQSDMFSLPLMIPDLATDADSEIPAESRK